MMRINSRAIALLAATTCGIVFAGCDSMLRTNVPSKNHPLVLAVNYKTQRSEQEWVLSDQSKLKAIYEEIWMDDKSGTVRWLIRRTPGEPRLKSLEYSPIDPETGETKLPWRAASPEKSTTSIEAYSLYEITGGGMTFDRNSQIALRVQVGEESEVLSPPWSISIAKD